MTHRRIKESLGVAALALGTVIGCGLLVWILATVLWKGAPAMSWEFLSSASKNSGLEGGIVYQIFGTLLLVLGAVALSLPLAIGSVLFTTEYLPSNRLKRGLRGFIQGMNAVPSILFGLMGYLVFGVLLNTGVSWVTGVLILAVMILPTLQLGLLQTVEAVPLEYRETALALGLPAGAFIRSVLIPESKWGAVTATLLGLARAGGETSAIMFTATTFSGVTIPTAWDHPVTTLQTHLLVLAQEGVEAVAIERAWGTALTLMLLTFGFISLAYWIRARKPGALTS